MSRLVALGLENPTTDEFLRNPSLRTVTSFFLGWVFIASISYLFNSPAIRFLRHRLYVAFFIIKEPKEPRNNFQQYSDEKQDYPAREWFIETLLGSEDQSADPLNLVLVLNLFAALSSLSIFFSLLTFDASPNSNGVGLCAFATAWGGLTSQGIRLSGLLRLSLDLKDLVVRKWELLGFWFLLLGLVAIAFVWNAIGNGVLIPVAPLAPIGVCYRRHFLLTAVMSHTISILLEGYLVIRFVFIFAPSFLKEEHKLEGIADVRIGRAASLLLLDILTMVPAAQAISIPADYIPFSIGTLVVLMAFNYNEARGLARLTRTDSIPSTRMLELERSPISSSGYLTRKTTYSTIPPRVPSKSSANGYVRSNNKLSRKNTSSRTSNSSYIVVGESPLQQTISRVESKTEVLPLQSTVVVRQRSNPVVRHIMPHQSVYLKVENRNSMFPSDIPPEFPMPPPIFPLPPPRALLPRLHVEIPDQDSNSSGSSGRLAQSGLQRSALASGQVPSAVYGSDIVHGDNIRDLTISQSAVPISDDTSQSTVSPETAKTSDTWKRLSRSSSQASSSSPESTLATGTAGNIGVGPLSAVGGSHSAFKSPSKTRNSTGSARRVSFQPVIGYQQQYGTGHHNGLLFTDTFLDVERRGAISPIDNNLLSPRSAIGPNGTRMRLPISPKGPRSPE